MKVRVKIKKQSKQSTSKKQKEWDVVNARLKKITKQVEVGWWDTDGKNGIPHATIAFWNEEGHWNGGIFSGSYTPPRPFMSKGFDELVRQDGDVKTSLVWQYVNGHITLEQYYQKIGERSVELMRKAILNWSEPPNADSTITLKGFNDPLIDTGSLYDNVKWRLVNK